MSEKELRIGNLVWDDYSGEMIVFGVVSGGINPRVELRKSEKLPAGSYDVNKIQGIPLTEDLLNRFGCTKLGKNWWTTPNGLQFNFNEENNCGLITFGSRHVNFWHVHTFQNIVVLTGEELKLN